MTPRLRRDATASREALQALTPAVRTWVEQHFRRLTPPQAAAVPRIHAGANVLVAAPTGTGKTLAAFLTVMSELVGDASRGALADGIHAVYVSPLRALSYDVHRNLERPLTEICEAIAPSAPPCVRVAVRTGDTTPAERRRLSTHPPHILVTTPESLAILLSTPAFAPHFSAVRWIVVDEIHAVAGNKRGTHLAVSLERLAAFAAHDPVRVGLSATVAPLTTVARWLVGPQRQCTVVSWTASRASSFAVRSALTGDVVPHPTSVQRVAARVIAERVAKHRTTLVFTNTRGATERLAHQLRQRFEEDDVAAHHSSLSREARQDVETRLREGKLRVVITSTSLELGIDIGTVDETVLLSSPRDVTRALQRIGRSGHRIDRHPAGLFIGTGVDDVLECIVVAERCAEGVLDPIRVPEAPLDVLAQQLVGMAAGGTWSDDDAYAMICRSAPYASLSRVDFDAVLDYLAESSEAMEERRVYAKIEREDGTFRARSKAVQTIFYQNVGTIAGGASIRVKPRGGDAVIGTVEEDFLEQLKPGDRFLLGGRVWAFLYAQGMTAFVAPAGGRPSVPRWASEILPATAGVALGVGTLRTWLRDTYVATGDAGVRAALQDRTALPPEDIEALVEYVRAQQQLSPIPDVDEILIERWIDPEDAKIVVHAVTAPLGRRANDALARVLALRTGKNAGMLVDDQAVALRVSARAVWNETQAAALFSPENFSEDVRRAVARSDLWGRRFRHVAATGLMLVKNYRGRSKFIGGMQHNARKIWTVLERTRPDFPLVRETYRTVLHDDLDVETAANWLREASPRITIRNLDGPPPLLFRLVAAGTTDALLLEERDTFLRRLWEDAQQRASSLIAQG